MSSRTRWMFVGSISCLVLFSCLCFILITTGAFSDSARDSSMVSTDTSSTGCIKAAPPSSETGTVLSTDKDTSVDQPVENETAPNAKDAAGDRTGESGKDSSTGPSQRAQATYPKFKKNFSKIGYKLLLYFFPVFIRYEIESEYLNDRPSMWHQANAILGIVCTIALLVSLSLYIYLYWMVVPGREKEASMAYSGPRPRYRFIYTLSGEEERLINEYIGLYKQEFEKISGNMLYSAYGYSFVIMLGSYLAIMLQNYLSFMSEANWMFMTHLSFFTGPIQVISIHHTEWGLVHLSLWMTIVVINAGAVILVAFSFKTNTEFVSEAMPIWSSMKRAIFWKRLELCGFESFNLLKWLIVLSVSFSFFNVGRFIYVKTALYQEPSPLEAGQS